MQRVRAMWCAGLGSGLTVNTKKNERNSRQDLSQLLEGETTDGSANGDVYLGVGCSMVITNSGQAFVPTARTMCALVGHREANAVVS